MTIETARTAVMSCIQTPASTSAAHAMKNAAAIHTAAMPKYFMDSLYP
ncbi:hypothetical protein [Pseudomonas sp. T1.Ur]|nr:hypothetical protein [Pseudomonas sp. T1.Ur]MCL6703589.1 hypothetical protein [Pseudomonas sp. T1.Ur]